VARNDARVRLLFINRSGTIHVYAVWGEVRRRLFGARAIYWLPYSDAGSDSGNSSVSRWLHAGDDAARGRRSC
jgi:hypothetical protein